MKKNNNLLELGKQKRNLKLFLKGLIVLSLLGTISFGILEFKKVLEGYWAWRYTSKIYEEMLSQMPVDYSFLRPFRNWKVEELKINPSSALSIAVDSKGREYVLFSKDPEKKLPIASLTKILSGLIIVKNYNLNKIITISKKAIETEEEIGFFKEGERFFVKDLLHSMMMESSNDAAMALAEVVGINSFVELMQEEAKTLGLENSRFVDPIGVDPDFPGEKYNFSTAKDLAGLTKSIIQKSKTDPRINFLLKITQKSEFYLYTSENAFHHKIVNTNSLLKEYQDEIIFGKTGYTPMAKECFLVVIKHPKEEEGFIINIILGSSNRKEEMKKLINWVKSAYIW